MEATTDTTTPTTTETPASAPASETPTSSAPSGETTSPAASQPSTPPRPKSFREALVQADAQAKTETPAVPPVTATIAPTDASPKPQSQEPPKETWPQILANARTKATAEAEAKWNQEYGWARAIPQQTIQEWSHIARRMSADPIGFLNEYVAELQRHPTHSIALRSEAGRILSGHANGEPPPDVELVNEQGQVTGTTYSAERLAKREAWLKQQWLGDVQREFGPLKAERDQERQTRATQEARAALETKADAVMAELSDILDGQTALLADVDRVMGEHPEWSAHKAALEVRKLKITPQQQSTAQAAAADTFRKKAAAQTADGRASASTPPKRLEGRKDIAEFLRRAEAQS